MKQLSSAQVRQMWLDFWASKGHSVEPSVSLVPVNDPTLLWINSGVATPELIHKRVGSFTGTKLTDGSTEWPLLAQKSSHIWRT